MSYSSTLKYFKNKADRYDEVEKQLYWVFSDELLWHFFKKTLDHLPKNFTFLDAGGGTGRWTEKILKSYPDAKGVVCNISDNMLMVAHKKLLKYEPKRLKIIHADIENQKTLKKELFNVSFNFHNVLGFTDNPSNFIQSLTNHTKKDGYVISFVPNTYHGIYFNLSIGNITEAKYLFDKNKGKFTRDMPRIHFFTPERIASLYKKQRLFIITLTGFPNSLYPNFQETQISGQTTSLKDLLSNKKVYKLLLKIEKKLSENIDIASRGNNIYIVGKKI